jgi:hypothetical protein
MTPIQVHFILDEPAYAAVSRHLVFQTYRKRRWILWALGASLLLVALISLLSGRWLMLVAFLAPTIGFLVLMRSLLARTFKTAYGKQPELKEPIEYQFGQDSIFFKTAVGEAQLPWDAFQRAVETPLFFLLYHAENQANPVLKSGFQSPEHIDQLRLLLQQKQLLQLP